MNSSIVEGFLSMNRQAVLDSVLQKLQAGTDPLLILKECQESMEQVGKRFESGEFFLSELIYSAEIFKEVSPILQDRLAGRGAGQKIAGVVVFGTPQGDIHDLGKNIVIAFMRASGFTVHDLGVDVPPQKFIQKLKETPGSILALSALITPALLSMQKVIELLKESGLRERTFVIIGGPVTTDLMCQKVGADARANDAVEGVRFCKQYHASRS
jgi:methanogenic corrinoid protein MtbC1